MQFRRSLTVVQINLKVPVGDSKICVFLFGSLLIIVQQVCYGVFADKTVCSEFGL